MEQQKRLLSSSVSPGVDNEVHADRILSVLANATQGINCASAINSKLFDT
jgi:hypothetical protein